MTPLGLIFLCASKSSFVMNRRTKYRRDYQTLFPKKIWVPENQKAFLRFLSYHTVDYLDDIEKEQAENNRQRALVCGDSLTDIVVVDPLHKDKGTNTDQSTRDETTNADWAAIDDAVEDD